MKISAIADLLFEVDREYVVFDDAGEVTIGGPEHADSDELLLEMPDMMLDLQFGDSIWAVASNELPLDIAQIIAKKGDKTYGVYALEDPIAPDDVPEIFAVTIPVGAGWEFEEKASDYHALGDLIALSGDEKEMDDDAADVVHPVSVSDSDVDETSGGTETASEDDEVTLTEIQKMNDAELLGEDHPEMQELLQKPFVFMTGSMYGQKDRRNTQDGDWQRAEMPLVQWLAGGGEGKNQWGLSRHPVAKSKEGSAIVLAESLDGARKDAAIKTMYAVGLDIDSGAALDDVIDALEEKGLFAVVYTSFSHGKSQLVLKHDDIMRKLKLDESPNRTQIQIYLREHHKDRYDEAFINGIKVVEGRKQTPDGLRTILETPALDKFRVILPLWEPVELADLGATVNQWKDVWADAVTGVAVNMLGVNFDSTSCDVNRLFFTPRHPADAEDWYCAVVQGKPLRFEDITPFSKTTYVKERDPGDAFAQAGGGDTGEKREDFFTASGMSLNRWHNKHKDRFLIADVIETFCPDKIRVAGGEKPGTVHLECPFEHEHSSEGGTATMAMNPDENEMGFWTIFCKHDSCAERDKLEFIKEMLDSGWFEESVLTDEDWNIPLPDEDTLDDPEPEGEEKELTPEEQAEKFTIDASDDEIKKFIKRQIRLGCDNAQQARINEVLAKKTALNKTTLNKFFKEIRVDLSRKNRENDEDGSGGSDSVPVINQWHFKEMVNWGEKRIIDTNAKNPRLFHYIDEIARIEETADRTPRIRMLSEKQFSAELNDITTWHQVSTMGDIERHIEKSAPSEVVAQLYHSSHTVYPRLRGLVTTPTFVKGGEMVTTPGFHESGLYYWNTGDLDVPQVSEEPTEDELVEAKRLLVEEVFADFPLGGMTRDEIVHEALDGEGIPAVANLIAMLLLMFSRDMIDGPTPGHLITKPTPGTGASLLTDICSKLAHGEVTPALPLPSNKDEMEKTLLTIISDGSPIIYFDNIEQSVDSGSLASALTAPKFKGRRLGASQTIEAEVRAVWVLCGNNVRMSQELVRRLVMIDLDANMSNPGQRKGWRHADLGEYVLENRGELIWAALTLIQNWVAKGMKGDSSEILNSYENWSRVMGGILRDAGIKGFLTNRSELKERASDGGEDEITLFLDTWWDRFQTKDVLMRANDPETDDLIKMAIQEDLQLPLRLKKSVDDDPTYDPRQFQKFLGTYEGRVMPLTDGTEVKIVRLKRVKNGYPWKLEVTKPGSKGDA